jgi:hypothetical protein
MAASCTNRIDMVMGRDGSMTNDATLDDLTGCLDETR